MKNCGVRLRRTNQNLQRRGRRPLRIGSDQRPARREASLDASAIWASSAKDGAIKGSLPTGWTQKRGTGHGLGAVPYADYGHHPVGEGLLPWAWRAVDVGLSRLPPPPGEVPEGRWGLCVCLPCAREVAERSEVGGGVCIGPGDDPSVRHTPDSSPCAGEPMRSSLHSIINPRRIRSNLRFRLGFLHYLGIFTAREGQASPLRRQNRVFAF